MVLYETVTEWSGGLYVSPSMAGSRAGALIAAAWASMMSLGENGKWSSHLKVSDNRSLIISPKVPKVKMECSLRKLIVNYRNFQNMFLII